MNKCILDLDKIKQRFNLDKRYSKTLCNLADAILMSQTLNLNKISEYINEKIKPESVYRKLQRFISKVELEDDLCSQTIMEILDTKGQIILVFDRTYWMHGKTHLNFLYLSIYYRGVAVPIYFKMLTDIKGHSSVLDRKELLDKFIKCFGKERIAYVVADREFDGNEWLSYLNKEEIYYVQRLKENLIHMTNSKGEYVKSSRLCSHIKPKEFECFGRRKIYKTHGFQTYITAAKNQNNNILLLAHSPEIKDPLKAYSLRWSIESGFKAMKSGGFNIDKTSVTNTKKLTTLYKIVAILVAITHKMGVLIDKKTPIKIKTHGRKAQSFIKLALKEIFCIKKIFIKTSRIIKMVISNLKALSPILAFY